MSTAQYMGLIAAILYAAYVADSLDDTVGRLTLLASVILGITAVIWAVA